MSETQGTGALSLGRILLLSAIVAIGGCAPDADEAELGERDFALDAAAVSLPQEFQRIRRIDLHESDSVLNVLFLGAVLGPNGELAIADRFEAKVRIYDSRGRLIRQFGRRGDGPMEFQMPMDVRFWGRDSVLVVDALAGLSIWDTAEGRLIDELNVELPWFFGVRRLADESVAIAGMEMGRPRAPLLHRFSNESNEITDSAAPLSLPRDVMPFASSVSTVVMDVAFGRIGVMYGLSDTLYLLDEDDWSVQDKVRLEIPGFDYDALLTAEGPTAKAAAARVVRFLRLLDDGRMVVQYVVPIEARERYGLALLAADGSLLRHWENTPQLVAAQPPEFYFVAPDVAVPNVLEVVRLPELPGW